MDDDVRLERLIEDDRKGLRALMARKMVKAEQFDFELITPHQIEFTPKEKLYIAYAVVMRYAFQTILLRF